MSFSTSLPLKLWRARGARAYAARSPERQPTGQLRAPGGAQQRSARAGRRALTTFSSRTPEETVEAPLVFAPLPFALACTDAALSAHHRTRERRGGSDAGATRLRRRRREMRTARGAARAAGSRQRTRALAH
jgi:hypothetical protein